VSVVTSIDAARRLASVEGAKQMELATWDFADAIVKDVPADDVERSTSSHAKDGSQQALRLLAEQLARAGFDYSVIGLSQRRATALAWPEDTRVHEGAGFTVHRELRGRDDRIEVLRKLMRQHGGKVTQRQVRTWKQEQNPPKFRSWSDTQRDNIAALIKRAAPGAPEAKEELAGLLMAAARELLGD
jgi:hypothetical protein